MKSLLVSLMGLMIFIQSDATQQPTVLGHVRLSGGLPVAGAQVMLFDLSDLRRGAVAQATTDEAGQFELPLAALGGAFALPEGFVLGTNYPNPFNPATIIPYELAATSPVKLEVFNTLGQRIVTLVDGNQEAGSYQAQWDGTDAAGHAVAAGLYFYRLTVDGESQTGRMVLVDGQAGVPMSGAGVEDLPTVEFLSATYGLVVSGPGMVTYVDADFGAEVRMGAVDIAVEARRDAPLVEPAQSGILGDVDNNGQVDIADGLLIAAYSVNTATALPNNGDIALGDVNGDNQTDITDAWLLATYEGDLAALERSVFGRGKAVGTLSGDVLFSDDFSSGNLSKWTTQVAAVGARWGESGSLEVENGALKLVGTAGGNYTVRASKDIFPTKTYSNYVMSFDWKSTVKETPYGVSLVRALFYNSADGIIGELLALNTGFPNRPFEDHGGPPGRYGGVFKEHESFGWERVTINTSTSTPLINTGDVHKIKLGVLVYNDAGSGGDLYVDNFSFVGSSDGGGGAVGKIYWANASAQKIQRANLDGSQVQDLVTGLDFPDGLALDVSGDKIYWTDRGTDKIQRANLDGSQVQDLVTGLDEPIGLALDVYGDKIYWTEYHQGKIQRANLDGSQVEDVVTGLNTPHDLALEGKIYWVENSGNIRRSNIDGSQVQDIVTGLGYHLPDIALGISGGKIYWIHWTEADEGKIQRANLDGSQKQDLVTGLNAPRGIELDVSGGKIYWTEADGGTIGRSNLDGSQVEALVTGLGQPRGIALQVSDQTQPPPPSAAFFTLDWGSTDRPRGITYANDRFYVVNDPENGEEKVYVYTSSGDRVESAEFKLDEDNIRPTGITYADGRFYVLDNDNGEEKVYVYTSSGDRIESAEFELYGDNENAQGITYANGKFYVVDRSEDDVFVYRNGDLEIFSLDDENGNSTGITYANGKLYVLDSSDDYVYVYTTGFPIDRVESAEFKLNEYNSAPQGITYANGKFYVLNYSPAEVYEYDLSESGGVTGVDLVVSSASVSNSNPAAGSQISMDVTVLNQGSKNMPSSSRVYFDLSEDAVRTDADTELTEKTITTRLGSNKTAEVYADDLPVPSTPGTYYYIACADAGSGVDVNTDNNCRAVRVDVGGGGNDDPDSPSPADDHGDTPSEATQITTAETSGYLSPGDTDYFWVPMSSPAELRVELDPTGEEIAISIYDGSGTSPGGEGFFSPNAIILLDASPDTYYIQVQGVSNSTEGNYTLKVKFTEYIEDGLLEGRSDSIKEAIHITTGSTTGHYISYENDRDWFWVRVGGSGTLTAYTTTTSGINTHGSLYDGSGNELDSDDNTGDDQNFRVSAGVSPGTYYIQVQEPEGEPTTGIGGYTLHVNSMATDDHADSRSDATRITIGSTAVGYISGTSDDDYFRVRVSGSGTLTAYTTSDVDNYGSLYNSLGTELASDDIRDNPSDRRFRNFQVSAEVNPGTYYIRVRGHGSGRYLLRVMYEPDEEGFNIELVFTDSVTTYERDLVRRAAARWMSIITGDLPACDFSENPRTLRLRDQLERLRAFFGADISVPDLSFELNDVVDDLRLYVHTLHIPSEDRRTTRGYAKQYLQRSNKSTSLPVAGFIVLNKEEIDESNAKTLAGLEMPDKDGMYHTTVHEIGHALGFAWQILDDNGLLSGGERDFWLFDMINIDVNFTGQRAITAFNNAGGLNYTGDKVPIENNGEYGTQRSHWRYLVFDPRPYIQKDQPQFIRPSELMVGQSHLNRSLSAITVQALADLGYQVDVSQADPYRLPSNRNLGIAKPVAGHSSDHGRENMNCILPGPIHVVDENGRTIRIIGE